MSLIQFLANLVAAVPILDKWYMKFEQTMKELKTQELEKRARSGDIEELQKHAGEDS